VEKTVDPERARTKIWPMRFACWMTKAADIHSEYVILIVFHGNNG